MRIRSSAKFLAHVLVLVLVSCNAVEWDDLYEEIAPVDPMRGFEIVKHIPLSVLTPSQPSGSAKERIGVLRSDVVNLFPELLHTRELGEASVNQDALFAHMLGSVQVLHQQQFSLQARAQQVMREAVEYSEFAVRTVEETAARAREALELQIRSSSVNTSIDALLRKIENAHTAGNHHRDNLQRRGEALRSLYHQHSLSLQQAVQEHEAAITRLNKESTDRMLADVEKLERAYLQIALELASATSQQEVELIRQQSNTSVHAVKAAIEAQREAETENLELTIRMAQEKAKRDREVWRTTAQAASTVLKDWTIELTSNPKLLLTSVGVVFALIAAIQILADSISFAREYVQLKFSQPSVLRQSANTKPLPRSSALRSPADFAEHFGRCGLVLPKQSADQLAAVAHSIARRTANGLPLPHLLIHGGPGTGKSKVAEALAAVASAECATIAGGDISPLGNAASTQLRHLISWAERGRRKKVLIVEEAEALLTSRTSSPSEAVVGCLTTVLAATGSPSNNFMFILCTSQPDEIDSGILDRIDHVIELTRLHTHERTRLARLFMEELILRPGTEPRSWWKKAMPQIDVSGMDVEAAVLYLATKSEGWSGRDIHKVFLAAQASAHMQPGCKLTSAAFQQAVDMKHQEIERQQGIPNANTSNNINS